MKALHIVKTAYGATWAYHQIRVLRSLGSDIDVALPSVTEGLAPRYRERFERSAYLDKSYKDELKARVERIREHYGLASGPIDYRPEIWAQDEQMTLFEL